MQEINISPYTLSFKDDREEEDFRFRQMESDLPLLRYLSLLAFFLEAMYCIKDITWSSNIPLLVVNFRLYYLTPLMLLTYMLTYTYWIKGQPKNMYILSILVMISLVLGQYFMTGLNDNPDSSFAKTLPLIFFSTFLFSGVKFKHVIIISPILILSYAVVIIYYENISTTAKINDSLLVAMNFILAIFFKYILEKNRRRNYVRSLIIEENERNLEKNLRNEKTLSAIRKDLIGILAHDIRAPLGNLKGVISLLDAKTIDSNKGEELLGQVSERIGIITNGVDDLLTWIKSKEEGQEFEATEFYIEEFVDEILKIGQDQIETKKIRVIPNVKKGLTISTDRGALQTIIRNLLSNAIKFSHSSGEIHLNARRDSQKVVFEIVDFGIGIDGSKVDKMTETFYSTPGTNEEPGIGLGLQICTTLLKKLKSELMIDSSEGKGTKMSFVLANM